MLGLHLLIRQLISEKQGCLRKPDRMTQEKKNRNEARTQNALSSQELFWKEKQLL